MAFCPKCGAATNEGAVFCSNCGDGIAASAPPSTAATAGGGLESNVAALLSYLFFVIAIVFLVVDPYRKDRFVRFHAFQSLFFVAAWVVLWVGLSIVTMVLFFIPGIHVLMIALYPLVSLAGLALWILLMVQAFQNKKFKLPVLGDLAEKQANAL